MNKSDLIKLIKISHKLDSLGYFRSADILSKKLPEEKDLSTQAEQMFRLAEIYRRSGEFQLSLDTQEKIAADKLHPDLQLAAIKLKQFSTDKQTQKIMFKELL